MDIAKYVFRKEVDPKVLIPVGPVPASDYAGPTFWFVRTYDGKVTMASADYLWHCCWRAPKKQLGPPKNCFKCHEYCSDTCMGG